MSDILEYQRELFSLLDEFFRRATGKTAQEFASLDRFSETVPSLAARASLVGNAWEWAIPRLRDLYVRNGSDPFAAARMTGGIKVVLGGSSRFGRTHLNAVRRLALYADTVLIPDPVFAWLETERPEERFRHVQVLEAMFFLLRLKPFVDSTFGYPPILVFPSFDRLLSKHDPATQASQSRFLGATLSSLLEQRFSSAEEVANYVTNNGPEFLDLVSRKGLFVDPGGPVGEPLDLAVERYRQEIRSWRSPDHIRQIEGLSKSQFVCNAIFERLEPQFHLIENANELRAQPLLSVEQQAYYFRLCASAAEDLLEAQDAITPSTRASIEALSRREFEWLSHAGIDALVEMRQNNENERFRKQLSESISPLSEASLADLDRVASEVSRSVGSLLNEYRKGAREIEDKFRLKYRGLAAGGWLTVGALLIPHLAPLIASFPAIALGGAYAHAKTEELRERRELASSLVGIVAHAKDSADDCE
jgi:hypothetical protein